MDAGFPRAVRAAKVTSIDFHAVADDSVLALAAYGRKRGDCAFKAVEGMSPARHRYVEGFVVVVAALFASCHWRSLVSTAIPRRKSVPSMAVRQDGHARKLLLRWFAALKHAWIARTSRAIVTEQIVRITLHEATLRIRRRQKYS